MQKNIETNAGSKLNKGLVIPTILFVLFVAIPLIVFAEHPKIQAFISSAYRFISYSFGWSYIIIYLIFGVFMFYIALSPYGKIKLGGKDAKPKYGNFHWASMIIAAGHGIALVNWVMVEPLITNALAPLGTGYNEAFTYEVAAAYTFFHWGPMYWVLFLVAGVPMFYFLGVRQRDKQLVSVTVEDYLGKKGTNSILGIICDVIVIIALAAGIGTTITVAVQLVAGLSSPLLEVENVKQLEYAILGIFTVVTIISLMRPVSRGMRILSDSNSVLALAILALVLIGGPTAYFFNMGINMLGTVMDIFPRISGWVDPFAVSNYPQNWTIFYAAWIYAYAPMMGVFFASISIGRTLRETILGVFFFGCLSTFLFCSILGAFALHIQYEGIFDLYGFYVASCNNLSLTVLKVLSLAPMSKLLTVAFLIMCTIFLVTTIDAATRVLASMTTTSMYAGEEPPVASKVVWCLAMVLLVFALLFVGGLSVVQALCVMSAIPLAFLGVIMNYATWKAMRKDFPQVAQKNILCFEDSETAKKEARLK